MVPPAFSLTLRRVAAFSLLTIPSAALAIDWQGEVSLQWRSGYELALTGLGEFLPTDTEDAARRIYDDGFVGMDQFDNVLDWTSYWSYQSAGQIPEDRQVVVFSSASAPPDAGASLKLDGGPGLEVAARGLFRRGERHRLGFLVAAGYGRLSETGAFSIANLGARVLRDAYPYEAARADFIAAAPPGYAGDTSGVGPLLRTDFSRTMEDLPFSRSVEARYHTDLTGFSASLGMSGEWDLDPRWSLRLDGGLSLHQLDFEVRLQETVSIGSLPRQETILTTGEDELLIGYFGRLLLVLKVAEGHQIQAGVRLAHHDEVEGVDTPRRTTLEADRLLYLEAGWTFDF